MINLPQNDTNHTRDLKMFKKKHLLIKQLNESLILKTLNRLIQRFIHNICYFFIY
jgi:hypothetical protein